MPTDDLPRYEYRAWSESFPALPQPEGEGWQEETYLVAPGRVDLNVKIRGSALEIKELVSQESGLHLWRPSAALEFPIPALTLERELLDLLQLGLRLHHEHYGRDELLADIVEQRGNVFAIPLRKRRRLYEIQGCRAETAEVELDGRKVMTAAAEHEDATRLMAAMDEMGLDRYANLAYPAALLQLRGGR